MTAALLDLLTALLVGGLLLLAVFVLFLAATNGDSHPQKGGRE